MTSLVTYKQRLASLRTWLILWNRCFSGSH